MRAQTSKTPTAILAARFAAPACASGTMDRLTGGLLLLICP